MSEPIRIEKEGNVLWPLPADYFDLSGDGKRLARINACQQWLVKSKDLQDKGENYLGSLRFFDAYYLAPDHSADFNPYFYPKDPFPTPNYHELISHHGACNRLLIAIGPRGGAKSMLSAKNMLLRLRSCPAYSYVYCTSTQDNAARMAETVRQQFASNGRMVDDWGPIVPKRGEATFSANLMYLKNRSWIQYVSIDSRLRGLRPSCFQVDDPEWDPKASTPMSVVREQMERMLFSVILPTVMEEGAMVNWYATFVSKQHYAWIAAGTDPEGQPLDPRFEHWYRIIIRAAEEHPETGKLLSCWPEKWPATKKERLEYAIEDERYYDTVSLEEIKSIVGPRVWQSEYMANPGQAEDSYFGDLTKDRHGWWYEDIDAALTGAPWRSAARLCWKDKDNNMQLVPLHEVCKQFRTFMTVDTSYTSGPASDFKVACVMAHGPKNALFVLDLWAAQCDQKQLESIVFQYADKWRVPLVGVEYIHQGIALYNALQQAINTRSQEMAGVDYLPKILKIKPGYTEKQAKIAGALGLRFHHDLIKLPFFWRNQRPWRELFNQVAEFNPDAHNGGLQHDDIIDAVAMHQYIVGGKIRVPEAPPKEPDDVEALLAAGKEELHGIPLGATIDWRRVPTALGKQLMQDKMNGPDTDAGGKTKV
jgi:hypothetical protein